jgi:hypothetical protein
MRDDRSGFDITRRRFAFWVGLGLFSLGEKLHAGGFDELAAAVMRGTDPPEAPQADATPEHWTMAENNSWFWYERENLVDGKWKLTGITTPINKNTGERYALRNGYLDDSLVPVEVRTGSQTDADLAAVDATDTSERDREHLPDPSRRGRHGRPPSKWLRSLGAEELRIWLKTIDPPEAGVSGMTFWTHLTRDHSFDAKRIAGLTTAEQAKLHAAAHYGY